MILYLYVFVIWQLSCYSYLCYDKLLFSDEMFTNAYLDVLWKQYRRVHEMLIMLYISLNFSTEKFQISHELVNLIILQSKFAHYKILLIM